MQSNGCKSADAYENSKTTDVYLPPFTRFYMFGVELSQYGCPFQLMRLSQSYDARAFSAGVICAQHPTTPPKPQVS